MNLRFPDGMNADDFIRDYWQVKPLLLRGALHSEAPITPEELAGLALDERLESRLIRQVSEGCGWRLEHGPFEERDFADLPESHWTLLVQDVDKFVPRVASLMDAFRFLPSWRLDDVMVSYAADGGSVGPHADEYDVFLMQTSGQRLWQIDAREQRNGKLREDCELRILEQFEPQQQWLLEPGDCLYLPPGVAHWGRAKGHCVTCSIGFRAARFEELAMDWIADVAADWPVEERFTDRLQDSPLHHGLLSRETADELQRQLLDRLSDPESFRDWLGGFVTRQKDHLPLVSGMEATAPEEVILTQLMAADFLYRNSLSRMIYTADERGGQLFVNGQCWPLEPALTGTEELLNLLTDSRVITAQLFRPWFDLPSARRLIIDLVRQGHLQFAEEDPFGL
jgi:50S ribosomal protein L16 3-hydroxylase